MGYKSCCRVLDVGCDDSFWPTGTDGDLENEEMQSSVTYESAHDVIPYRHSIPSRACVCNSKLITTAGRILQSIELSQDSKRYTTLRSNHLSPQMTNGRRQFRPLPDLLRH